MQNCQHGGTRTRKAWTLESELISVRRGKENDFFDINRKIPFAVERGASLFNIRIALFCFIRISIFWVLRVAGSYYCIPFSRLRKRRTSVLGGGISIKIFPHVDRPRAHSTRLRNKRSSRCRISHFLIFFTGPRQTLEHNRTGPYSCTVVCLVTRFVVLHFRLHFVWAGTTRREGDFCVTTRTCWCTCAINRPSVAAVSGHCKYVGLSLDGGWRLRYYIRALNALIARNERCSTRRGLECERIGQRSAIKMHD